MFRVLKRTVSIRRFFDHRKHMFKLMGKEIIAFYAEHLCLTGPMFALHIVFVTFNFMGTLVIMLQCLKHMEFNQLIRDSLI